MKYSQAKAIILALRKAGWEKTRITHTYLKSFYLDEFQQAKLITFEELQRSRSTPQETLARMRRVAMEELTRAYYRSNGIYANFQAFTIASSELESMPVDRLDQAFALFDKWKVMPHAFNDYEDAYLELRGYRSGNTGDYQVLEHFLVAKAKRPQWRSITSFGDYDILPAKSGVYLHPKEGGKD